MESMIEPSIAYILTTGIISLMFAYIVPAYYRRKYFDYISGGFKIRLWTLTAFYITLSSLLISGWLTYEIMSIPTKDGTMGVAFFFILGPPAIFIFCLIVGIITQISIAVRALQKVNPST